MVHLDANTVELVARTFDSDINSLSALTSIRYSFFIKVIKDLYSLLNY